MLSIEWGKSGGVAGGERLGKRRIDVGEDERKGGAGESEVRCRTSA